MKLVVIGSSSDSHIVLSSPYVSSYHAEILLLDNGDIILEDKGSRNGTFLNDNKLQPNKEVTIKRGDNVRFANIVLDWNLVPMAPKIDMRTVKEMRGIGTNFRNKYQLQGDRVSRFHATLKKMSSGKWYIQDHSTNGTTVNGTPVPKDQEVRIKKGDRIQCAGVGVPNPCDDEGGNIDWGKNGKIVAGALMIIALCIGIKYLVRSCSEGKTGDGFHWGMKDVTMDDNQIYERYKTSTVLLFAGYYFEVSAGDLNFDLFELPTKVIVVDGKLIDVSKTDQAAMYFGTGFFVSKDGKLITNLHIAKPWLFDDAASEIESIYKKQLQIIANTFAAAMPQIPLGAYVSEVKVEGKLKFIGLIPNGEDFDDENFLKCKVLSAGDDTNVDVALIRTVKGGLPDDCTYVKTDSICVDEAALAVGSHIYTMGFPAGMSLQELENNHGIQLFGRGGSIIQESNDYSFGFDAASYGGASGSPIFNDHGQLVGVLNAGFAKTQGFNFGIKAKYVMDLINGNSK